MRKIYLIIFAVAAASTLCNAQVASGKKTAGGNLSFGYNKNTQTNNPDAGATVTAFSFSPSLGKFRSATVLDEIGLVYSYRQLKAPNDLLGDQKQQTQNVGLALARTKLTPLARDLYFTIGGSIGATYSFSKTSFAVSSINYKGSGIGAGVNGAIGVMYCMNKRFLLSCSFNNLVSIAYTHTNDKSYDTNGVLSSQSKSDNFNLATGLSNFTIGDLVFGVRYMF